MDARARTRPQLALALVALLSVAACTAGTPVSSESPASAVATGQPPSAAPATSAAATASPERSLGAWKRLPDEPAFERSRINDVTEGGPGYVAVGCRFRGASQSGREERCDAAVWTSPDGQKWTRSTQVDGARDATISAVVAGGPGLVSAGAQIKYVPDGAEYSAAFWTSSDGIRWNRVPNSEAFKYSEASDVVAFGDRMVAAGGSIYSEGGPAVVWSSSDGLQWRRENTDEFGGFTGGALGVLGNRLILSGYQDTYCSTSCRRQVWTSLDGTRWTKAPDSPALDGAVGFRPAIAFAGRMLATGFIGQGVYDTDEPPRQTASLWSSADGVAWERITVPAPKRSAMGELVSVGAGLIGVGTVHDATGKVTQAISWTSPDGRNWKLEPVEPALRGVAIGRAVVTERGLVAFGVAQSDGLSRHAGIWLRPFEAAGG
jgi:hypothetical protein